MRNHTEFILSPITKILEDVVSASTGIGSGIETFPLCDYIMQSVFIKMTGFQEQKMKCVCWELATNDYEYRYDFTQKPLGECSNYKDKQKIYSDLIKQIEKYGKKLPEELIENKNDILIGTFSEIENTFSGTNLSIWAQNDFLKFRKLLNNVEAKHFANDKGTLFSDNSLRNIYDNHLYRLRNRIAHNTQSYQQNLPTLKTLISDDYIYENYFVYFTILVLIDKIFIELYKKYLSAIEDNT